MNRNNNNNAYSGRQHFWTSSKDVRDYDREMRRTNANDPNKFNVNVGKFNGDFNNDYYARQQNFGNEGRLDRGFDGRPSNLNYDNRDRYYDGSQFEGANRGFERGNRGLQYGPNGYSSNTSVSYSQGPPSTQSDWDHYAVRHQDSLIGDPIPFADDSLNGQIRARERSRGGFWNRNKNNRNLNNNQQQDFHRDRTLAYNDARSWNNDSALLGRDMSYGRINDNYIRSTDYEGPVAYDPSYDRNFNALKGNYSSGTVLENGYGMYGNGMSNGNFFDRSANRSWGSQPLWGSNQGNNLYGEFWRDSRNNKTPLLPDNPWTHNELGREYLDGRRDHLYKHTDDAIVHPSKNKKQLINTSSFAKQGAFVGDDLAYKSTTRSVPSALNYNNTPSSIPTPPPLPQWNKTVVTTRSLFKPRTFNRTTDYSKFDPRDSYFETKKPLFSENSTLPAKNNLVQEKIITQTTSSSEKILPPTTNTSLNTGFVPTRAN